MPQNRHVVDDYLKWMCGGSRAVETESTEDHAERHRYDVPVPRDDRPHNERGGDLRLHQGETQTHAAQKRATICEKGRGQSEGQGEEAELEERPTPRPA